VHCLGGRVVGMLPSESRPDPVRRVLPLSVSAASQQETAVLPVAGSSGPIFLRPPPPITFEGSTETLHCRLT
jgi:hypothetical protein